MASTPQLPLFPLGSTLMPGMRLPLQVFEERYVALLKHLVDSQGEELGFGVVAIRHGYEVGERANDLYTVGTLAVLDRIVQLTDGLFLVLGHGTRRFRLEGLDETAGTPWLTGTVTWLGDHVSEPARLPDVVDAVTAMVQARRDSLALELPPAPRDPNLLAYWAADGLDLAREDRQRLIELSETVSRLALVRRLGQRESALASELGFSAGPGPTPPSLN